MNPHHLILAALLAASCATRPAVREPEPTLTDLSISGLDEAARRLSEQKKHAPKAKHHRPTHSAKESNQAAMELDRESEHLEREGAEHHETEPTHENAGDSLRVEGGTHDEVELFGGE